MHVGAGPLKETVAGEYPVAAPALPPTAADARLADGELVARSQIVWGEHCSECAYPSCYSSCAFYDPRPDLNCRRFVAGIEDAGDGAMRIRFRKWGKLEGRGPAPLRPMAQAARRERGFQTAGRALAALPAPFAVTLALARRIEARAHRAPPRPGRPADAFLLEGWSNDGCERPMTLTLLQDDGGTWQGRMTLGPERSRRLFPLGPIAGAIDLSRPYLVQIEPVGEAEGVDVTLALADFVALRDPAVALCSASPAAAGGPLAKVVVWDLDETLWTGTLAEDGADGVTPRPAAVAALIELDRRGVLHSIASKNDPAEAEAALKRFGLWPYFLHPRVGWGPKSASVAAIAAALDLGLDSFVFIDDQPFERAEVSTAHPKVRTLDHTAVPGLTTHPWFAHPATPEAARRRSLYRAEAARGLAAEASGSDYMAFLRGSELSLDVRALDAADVARVHELSQRTNQLNFTGAKLTLTDVQRLAHADPGHARLTLRCADRWGDYGLIGFADLDLQGGSLDAFFMSCRVQRKRVENAAFAHLARLLAARGHARFAVRFVATERNGAAMRMLEELGFARDGEGWSRPIDRPFPETDVVRLSAPASARAA
jgi:FkbH-like protein